MGRLSYDTEWKMRILLVNKYLYPKGGADLSTLETGRLLSEQGHAVVFWGMNHPENTRYPFSDHFISHIDYNGPLGIT